MITMILLVFAFVLFALGTWGVPSGRVNLIAAGLACWMLSQLVGYVR